MTGNALDLAMANAIAAATRNAQRKTGGPFGAVILDSEFREVCTTANQVTATPDPTAHAEVVALRVAARVLRTHDLSGLTVVSSCEPCPMCLAACMWARVGQVFFAADRADAAAAGFDDQAFYDAFGMAPVVDRAVYDRLLVVRHVTVERLPFPDRLAPFEAWTRAVGKVAY